MKCFVGVSSYCGEVLGLSEVDGWWRDRWVRVTALILGLWSYLYALDEELWSAIVICCCFVAFSC